MGHEKELFRPAVQTFLKDALNAHPAALEQVTATQAGMTNRSFRFSYGGQAYILRIPGEGTDKLINRRQEAAVYEALGGDPISDEVIAIDPQHGFKLTRFWENTRNCDPKNPQEVRRCMELLRQFHNKGFQVGHGFTLYEEIAQYESLRNGESCYPDYEEVRLRCLSMRPFIRRQKKELVLSHIDAVPDNFLFVKRAEGETLHLIDWEYAGMHDPHVDLGMFAIYAGYDRDEIDQLMEWYFGGDCGWETRLKIYCYVALGGLLWSNWCEYKKSLGVDFGGYAMMQYSYASEYSRLFLQLVGNHGGGGR